MRDEGVTARDIATTRDVGGTQQGAVGQCADANLCFVGKRLGHPAGNLSPRRVGVLTFLNAATCAGAAMERPPLQNDVSARS